MFGKPVESESLELRMESGEGGGEHSASSHEQTAFDGLKTFQRFKPKILGAIEVTIGIVMALTAITYLAVKIPLVVVAIIYWGIFVYIPAGAMAIATDKKLTKAMVWGTLGMNVLVALSAIAGGVLHFFASLLFGFPSCHGDCHLRNTELAMLVLSIVLFIVSILVVASAVAALCSSRKQSK